MTDINNPSFGELCDAGRQSSRQIWNNRVEQLGQSIYVLVGDKSITQH